MYVITMRRDHPAPQWALVAMPDISTSRWQVPMKILALTEDTLIAARERGWLVLAKDSDFPPTTAVRNDTDWSHGE